MNTRVGILGIIGLILMSGGLYAQETFELQGSVEPVQTMTKENPAGFDVLNTNLDTQGVTDKVIATFTVNNNLRSGYRLIFSAKNGVLLASGTTGSDVTQTATKNITVVFPNQSNPTKRGDYLEYTIKANYVSGTFDAIDFNTEAAAAINGNLRDGTNLLDGTSFENSTATNNITIDLIGTKLTSATSDGKFSLKLSTSPSTSLFYDTFSETLQVMMISY